MAELVSDMSLVLQYPAPGGGFVCCGFSSGNLPAPVFIVVEGGWSDESRPISGRR